MTSMDKRKNATLGSGTRKTNVHVVLKEKDGRRDIIAVFTNSDKAEAYFLEHCTDANNDAYLIERHRVI